MKGATIIIGIIAACLASPATPVTAQEPTVGTDVLHPVATAGPTTQRTATLRNATAGPTTQSTATLRNATAGPTTQRTATLRNATAGPTTQSTTTLRNATAGPATGWNPLPGNSTRRQVTLSPVASSNPAGVCFVAAPASECRSFWHAELRAYAPLSRSPRVVGPPEYPYSDDTFGRMVGWEMGHSFNVAERWSVGGSLFADVGDFDEDVRWGVRARGRYWLDDRLSVELAPGYLRSNLRGSRTIERADGVTADTRINMAGIGFVSLRYDLLHLPGSDETYFQAPEGWHDTFSLGFGLDTRAALWTSAVGLVAYAALLGHFLSWD